MFKRIRKAITKITNILGGMTGMYKTLDKITDHPDIKITEEELIRIQRNKEFFKNEPEPIRFTDSNGDIQYRDQNTVNLSKIISKKLAKLVFNEGVTINVDDDATQEIVNDLLYDNRFRQVFGEELEGGYAISGLAIVPTYDELTETVKFVYCSADNFIPLDGNTNVVTEAAIINKYRQVESEALVFYTLFAIHKKTKTGYKIEHELYKSSDHNIVGQQVSLSTIEETAELSDVVTLEGLKNPLFVYIKLAGKNNVNYGSPLGLGVVDNAYRLLCNFNEKYDQYMNEVSTATRQLVASASFFEVKYDPITKRPLKIFDPKTQVWQKLDTDGENILEDFAPEIRAQAYIETLNFILRVIEQAVGFSSGTLSFDGKSVKTATEVISENTDTYQTRADNVLIIEQALSDLVTNSLYILDYYRDEEGFELPEDIKIEVDFDDGVFTSKTDRLKYIGQGTTLGLMSKQTAMIKAYGLSEEQAAEEWEKIRMEQQQTNPITSATMANFEAFGANELETAEDRKAREAEERRNNKE